MIVNSLGDICPEVFTIMESIPSEGREGRGGLGRGLQVGDGS
jgi:hypothetical protein